MAGQFWLLESAFSLVNKEHTTRLHTRFTHESTIVYADLYQRHASSRVNTTLAFVMVLFHCKRCANAIGKRKIIYDKNQPSKKK